MGRYNPWGTYGQNDGNPYAQISNQSEKSSEDASLERLLTASGVPNEVGRIQWPIGLRILGGKRPKPLRDQIDALFQVAATEAAIGSVHRNVTSQLTRDLDEFRQLLLKDKAERFLMTSRNYEEAEAFLEKLSDAEKVLQKGLGSPASPAEWKTDDVRSSIAVPESAKEKEIILRDNAFEPRSLTIAVGTTVEWGNRGRHQHTVTSMKGYGNRARWIQG